jgi:hypothetical protein
MLRVKITKKNIDHWQKTCLSLPIVVGSVILVGHDDCRMEWQQDRNKIANPKKRR